MKSSLDVKLTAFLAIAVFAALAVFKGPDFWKDTFSVASSAVTWTVALRWIFIKWVWKWKWLRILERLHKVPYLEGQWSGKYHSTGNANTPPDRLHGDASVEIWQPDLYTVKVIRTSGESVSRSYGEEILLSDDGIIQLAYSYRSEPNANVRDRSPISYGSARLTLIKDKRERLEGDYWTDQKTTGTLKIARK